MQVNKYTSNIISDKWIYGSYNRSEFIGDLISSYYNYVDIEAKYNGRDVFLTDRLADEMLKSKMIDIKTYEIYYGEIKKYFFKIEEITYSNEEIYNRVHNLRRKFFGPKKLRLYYNTYQQKYNFDNIFIDYREVEKELNKKNKACLYYISDLSYRDLLVEDILKDQEEGLTNYILCSKEMGYSMPTKEDLEKYFSAGKIQINYLQVNDAKDCLDLSQVDLDQDLLELVAEKKIYIKTYGEKGLFVCKNLTIPAISKLVASSYYSRAISNSFSNEGLNIIYIPEYLDIYQYVPIIKKTKCNYYHLYMLYKKYNIIARPNNIDYMIKKHGELFFNIYDDNLDYYSDIENLGAKTDTFYIRYIDKLLKDCKNIDYTSAYYDIDKKTFQDRKEEIKTDNKDKNKIRVDIIKFTNISNAEVIIRKKAIYPRDVFRDNKRSLRVCSNFLFFGTENIRKKYNKLIKDRPKEQLNEVLGHLDFMYSEEEARMTFPLYNKSCLALKKDGNFIIFNFSLSSGNIEIDSHKIFWSKENINQDIKGKDPEVILYTPMFLKEEKNQKKVPKVGWGRINILIIDDSIVLIRDGDLYLSPFGVIVSLSKAYTKRNLGHILREKSSDGYYRLGGLNVKINLTFPDGLSCRDIRWAYGGGLSLIRGGKREDNFKDIIQDEGWLNPLSKLTQEAQIHEMERHPRTAFCRMKDNSIAIMVVSGRSRDSIGANYEDMKEIARALLKDVSDMINLDGGGSSTLCLIDSSRVYEVNCPATSASSCFGMSRKINTMLSIELKNK